MKTKELLAVLKAAGFVLKRHGASHDIYSNGVVDLAVPRHKKELRTGTAEGILKEAGLKQP